MYSNIIEQLEPEIKQKTQEAKDAFQEYNVLIRGFLRDTMGLKLDEKEIQKPEFFSSSGNRDIRQITVKILDLPGLNNFNLVLNEIFKDIDLDAYTKISALSVSLTGAKEIMMASHVNEDFIYVQAFCREYLRNKNLDGAIKLLFKYFEGQSMISPFGCYYIKRREVQIYVRPILLFCKAKNLDFKVFVVMVLCHELAHGYSHIGYDKDRKMWDKIGSTELGVVEGIAQYFTEKFLEKYKHRIHKGPETFTKLLEYQADYYKSFQEWGTTDEQLYRAFVELRRNGKTSEKDFLEIITETKKAIQS